MPGASADFAAATVIVPAPVPLPGEIDSHGALSDAVQLSVPPPVLATVSVLDAGSGPSATALKDSEAGDTARAGGGGSTTNVTATVFGDPVAPAADTVTSVV